MGVRLWKSSGLVSLGIVWGWVIGFWEYEIGLFCVCLSVCLSVLVKSPGSFLSLQVASSGPIGYQTVAVVSVSSLYGLLDNGWSSSLGCLGSSILGFW